MMKLLRRSIARAQAALIFCVSWLAYNLGFGAIARRIRARGNDSLFESVDQADVGGVFLIEVLRDGPHGPQVIQSAVAKNLIVNTGKRQTWRQACALNTNDWDQARIGTSGAAASSAQTNVLSPVTGTINTVDQKTLLAGTRTFQLVISYPSGAGSKSATNIREVVILNQNTSPGGSALARSVFSAVNKTTADKLKIQYRARIT